jgi:hypothetical protein
LRSRIWGRFWHFDLTPVAASRVSALLIDECFANLECRVADTRLVNQYNFFAPEVVNAWIDPAVTAPQTMHHRGRGTFMVAGETIKLPSRMKQDLSQAWFYIACCSISRYSCAVAMRGLVLWQWSAMAP